MAAEQVIADQYALYNGDCIEVMSALPPDTVYNSQRTKEIRF